MTTSDPPDRSRSVTLSLSHEAQWTLHHVLLHRINWETTETAPMFDEPPSVEVFRAFETLDAGKACFTLGQLEAYHHATTWWELERAQIEQLLHRVTSCLDQVRAPCSAD